MINILIPKDIQDAVKAGISCPICNNGSITIRIDKYLNRLIIPFPIVSCDSCHREITIRYKEDPFEILGFVDPVTRKNYTPYNERI